MRETVGNRARQHGTAKTRSFEDISPAYDLGGARKIGLGDRWGEVEAKRVKIGAQQVRPTPLVPVGEQRARAAGIERGLDRQKGGGLGSEEAAVIERIGEIEAREKSVDAVVSGPRRDPEHRVGRQALNTRSKIRSMRRK